MAHPFKKVADDILEALLESGPRIGRSLRDRSDTQARKIRDDIDAIRGRDRELAARQRTPDSRVDRPQTSDATPEHDRPNEGPVEPLDVDTYKRLKDREQPGDDLEHDHMPSAAALIKAREAELGRKITKAERDALYDDATAIELPRDVHTQTRTWGSRNRAQSAVDALDLDQAARADYLDRIQLLLAEGYDVDDVADAIAAAIVRNRDRGIH